VARAEIKSNFFVNYHDDVLGCVSEINFRFAVDLESYVNVLSHQGAEFFVATFYVSSKSTDNKRYGVYVLPYVYVWHFEAF
jgi:hypothetical protein